MKTTRRGFLTTAAVAAAVHAQLHGQEHKHDHQEVPSDPTLRVKALESLLVEKGLVDRAALDALVDTFENKVGPRNGARVVARAWTDPAYKARLLADAPKAITELGFSPGQGEHMVVVENTPKQHNVIVCTLCSCYPWPVLGLPPVWYKSAAYRSRTVIDPRGVLAEFGLQLAGEVEVRVWDSTAELRYIVLPERPAGSEKMSEEELTGLVTRDAMVGVAVGVPSIIEMNGVHDMGGLQCMGRVEYERNEPVFHAPWEGRVYALSRAIRAFRKWNIDTNRHTIESLPPAQYLRTSYYERWLAALITNLIRFGLVTSEEMESGKPAPGSVKATPVLTVARAGSINRGIASSVDPSRPPLFKVGERVRARNINPLGHTRLPRYARGRTGVVVIDHGVYIFPDTNADFQGEKRQHVYSVRFSAQELWGEAASPRHFVHVDLWDDYLEHA